MIYKEITVVIKVPTGESCYYYENGERKASCSWLLKHSGLDQRWCKIFDDVNVSNHMKCQECLTATRGKQ